MIKYDNKGGINGANGAMPPNESWRKTPSLSPSHYGEDLVNTSRRSRRSRLDVEPPRPPSRSRENKMFGMGGVGYPNGPHPQAHNHNGFANQPVYYRQEQMQMPYNPYLMERVSSRSGRHKNNTNPYMGTGYPNANPMNMYAAYMNMSSANTTLNGTMEMPPMMRHQVPQRPASARLPSSASAGVGPIVGGLNDTSMRSNPGSVYNGGGVGEERVRQQRAEPGLLDVSSFTASEDGRGTGETGTEESDEELRRFELQGRRAQGARSATTFRDPFVDGGEAYYFGVVHLDLERVQHVMDSLPPPAGYYKLPPIERVAFIFYAAVYKEHYRSVDQFHKRFNREFYNFVCSGDSDDLALFKICKSIQDQHEMREVERKKRELEAAEEATRLEMEAAAAKRGEPQPVFDTDDVVDYAVEPEEVLTIGPVKYACQHAFATWGVGGKMVMVLPNKTPVIEELRERLRDDDYSTKLLDVIQCFRGPLIAGQTPTHTVRLYIQRQMEAIRRAAGGAVAQCDVVDALLVWQLLEMLVQQQGRVTGPDVATLLTNAIACLDSSEKDKQDEKEPTETPTTKDQRRGLQRFTDFLLGGHVDEAVESAMSDGLFADAMTLVRRMFPNDPRKILAVESRFLALRSYDDPVTTLISVASDQPPPMLTNPPLDDHKSWRKHAAIVLANLNTPTAMRTIYYLGLALAKRNQHCAADFCLLAVCILAGYDPFAPVVETDGDEHLRRHISLVHAGEFEGIDHIFASANKFSINDLHATDVFDFALRLTCENSPLAKSVDYQTARINYAKLLATYGGFATDAFRYCMETARTLWPYYQTFPKESLVELCDLAERLQYVASATPAETAWIESLRAMIESGQTDGGVAVSADAPPNAQGDENLNLAPSQPIVESSPEHQSQQQHARTPPQTNGQGGEGQQLRSQQQVHQNPGVGFHNGVETVEETSSTLTGNTVLEARSVSNFNSLSNEAQSWHDEHQTPIEIARLARKPEVHVAATTTSTAMPTTMPSTPPMQIPRSEPLQMRGEYDVASPMYCTPSSSPPSGFVMPQPQPPMAMTQVNEAKVVKPQAPKSPRAELEDLWGTEPLQMQQQPVGRAQQEQSSRPQTTQQISQNHVANGTAKPLKNPMNSQNQENSHQGANGDAGMQQNGPRGSSKGWLGSLRQKVINSLPSTNKMILPADNNPTIRWDPVQKRYIGEGVEEETAAAPPPAMGSNPSFPANVSTGSLRSVRSSRGSRYLQATGSAAGSLSPPTTSPAGMPPDMGMPMPPSFGFIPAPVDDVDGAGGDAVDPFSTSTVTATTTTANQQPMTQQN